MLLRILTLAFVLMMTTPIFAQTPMIETGVPQILAKWRGANYSDVRYKLNLTLEKMSPTLKGTIEISVKNNADQIILDWRKIRGKENLSTVSNISVNGRFVVLNPDSNQLSADKILVEGAEQNYYEINEHLVFKDGVTKGENVIKLDFTSPILTSGAAITRYVDKEDNAEYIYSLFVPSDASTAFPVFDQPDLKARFTLEIDAPKDWDVIANDFKIISTTRIQTLDSSRVQVAEGHRRHSFFETKQPISTYVFAFAAGEFERFKDEAECIKIVDSNVANKNKLFNACVNSIYVRKSQAEKFKAHAKEVFRLNREAIKYLESYFDYKFPFPKYDLVLIPEFPFGGMEHAGATFLRESSIIFPNEPTKNDFVSRANLIFHEAAHQWFGDTVTMKWFDDLWLKEGFAEFMAYKTLAQVMPEYNAWKIFYERNKQLAYLTDSTKGTTPIYQEIPNLSSAKSAYGNIVYRKAPSFLKQAEFTLGEKKFQTAVRAFLKKHQFANAEWTDLVSEFSDVEYKDRVKRFYSSSNTKGRENFRVEVGKAVRRWADVWVKSRGLPIIRINETPSGIIISQKDLLEEKFNEDLWIVNFDVLFKYADGKTITDRQMLDSYSENIRFSYLQIKEKPVFIFPNYQDYGYGIFLLDEKSRTYVLQNIQNEKDDFLRTMMWGALWDSVREAELAPKDYVELVIKNINVETDESTIQTLLSRVSTAMNYYLNDKQREEFAPRLEAILIDKMQNAPTVGQRITFYRAFLNIASSENARKVLKEIFKGGNLRVSKGANNADQDAPLLTRGLLPLKTKDKFDIVTRLLILGDKDAPNLLAELEKTEMLDEAKRYAYAAKAGIANRENKAKFWNDFVNNKDISESWIEAAFVSFNSVRHADLTLPYLEKALTELPNLKRNRKIFFVNGWLSAFIGGQRSEEAVQIVNKFLADNPNLDKDLRLKILENADGLERAVKIRSKF